MSETERQEGHDIGKDMTTWLQNMPEIEKPKASLRLRRLLGKILQKGDTPLAVKLGGLVAAHSLQAPGLHYLVALAMLKDGRPYSAQAALALSESQDYPQESAELALEIKNYLTRLNLPLQASYGNLTCTNLAYANRYLGQRCFILGNAPSLKNHNLKLLCNDVVFSVSNGYLHSDYAIYRPHFHCLPTIPYDEMRLTHDHAAKWLADMDEKIWDATITLSVADFTLAHERGIFANRSHLCMDMSLPWQALPLNPCDICGPMSGVQSVPIMALMLAFFMGFEKIYLLGIDHTDLITRRYNYFYKKSMNTGLERGVDTKGNITDDNFTLIKCMYKLFSQYSFLKNESIKRNTHIYNTNPHSFLDIFPLVEYNHLF